MHIKNKRPRWLHLLSRICFMLTPGSAMPWSVTMRTMIFAILAMAIATLLIHSGPVYAQNYPWCAQGGDGSINCECPGRKPKSPGRDARGFVLQQLASNDQKRGPSGAPQLKR
jgi:hypothetical protein